jgi:hypothetical protein
MALEDSAFCGKGLPFVSVVIFDHPRLGRVRMNAADYDPATCGEIVEPATLPPVEPGKSDPVNKDPRIDANGNTIADEPGCTTPL